MLTEIVKKSPTTPILPALTKPEHYETLRSLSFRSRDWQEKICSVIRSSEGIQLQIYEPLTGSCSAAFKGPVWSDSTGWASRQYYSTIRAEVLPNPEGIDEVYVIARSAACIHVYSCDLDTGVWT